MKLRINYYNPFILLLMLLIFSNSCKKEDNNPSLNGKVMDIDGNVYTTVTIGSQVWLVENLKVTKYRNGDPIPNVTDHIQWGNLTTGAYCEFNNNIENGAKYGNLYNWYAVNDSRNIAPIGWHISTDEDWTILVNNLKANYGTPNRVVIDLAAKTDWAFSDDALSVGYDLSQNNSSGFTALPGGCRFIFDENHNVGGFVNTVVSGLWWSSDESNVGNAFYRAISVSYDEMYRGYNYKGCGFSVRCVKD